MLPAGSGVKSLEQSSSLFITRSELSGVHSISKVLAEFEAIVENGDGGSGGDRRDLPGFDGS